MVTPKKILVKYGRKEGGKEGRYLRLYILKCFIPLLNMEFTLNVEF